MSWDTFKQSITEEKRILDDTYSSARIQAQQDALKNAFLAYVNRAGIAQNPGGENAYYTSAENSLRWLTSGIKQYQALNKRISDHIQNLVTDSNLRSKLSQVGQVQDDINRLEKELKIAKQELETSIARQQQVDKPATDQSFYQGFGARLGFTKPLHVYSIPFLVGFGIFILFLSGLLLRDFFGPSLGSVANTAVYDRAGIMSFFTDARFYSVAAGASLVFAVVGVLAYAGQFGPTVK
jgi:hypothetical protein